MRLVLFFLVLVAFVCSAQECIVDPQEPGVVSLWNGVKMPRVGFGTAAMRGTETEKATFQALHAGFRHIDTAAAREWYDAAAVGTAVQRFLAENTKGVERQDLFLTTKLHPKDLGVHAARKAVENMFVELRTDVIDLVLIHFPRCGDWIPACVGHSVQGDWQDAWGVLEEFYRQGRLRAIGLSNFDADELEFALQQVDVKPHVVQNWMDPFHSDAQVREVCSENGIAYTSYSTLGGQWEYRAPGENLVFASRAIQDIAAEKQLSVVDVTLLWALQSNAAVLPRSTNAKHIVQNARLSSLLVESPLSPSQMDRINELAIE